MADDPAFLQTPSHFELVFVGPGGATTQCFGYQPTTDDIGDRKAKTDRYCVQLIGDQFEVYDLTTLKRFLGTASIGLPVFVHTDPDAAIMWALMNL